MEVGNTVGARLVPVLGQLVRLLRQGDTSRGLSTGAMSVLRRLSREGPARLTDLARNERTSQPGMTQLVGRLAAAGLVRRVPDPRDGRVALVSVTEAGAELLAESEARYAATLDAVLERLDAADREAVAAALPALTRLAEAATMRPAATPVRQGEGSVP